MPKIAKSLAVFLLAELLARSELRCGICSCRKPNTSYMYVMTRQKREHGHGEFDDKGMEGTCEPYKGVKCFGGLITTSTSPSLWRLALVQK